MRSWEHSGFSVDNSAYLSPGETFGLERLAQYILRCPFSLARVVRLTEDGSVIYRAEKDHCRRFPGPASGDLRGGPRRNFQVFRALDFLAELTQHIPEKGEHLVRYYGWYSHRQRGIRVRRRSRRRNPLALTVRRRWYSSPRRRPPPPTPPMAPSCSVTGSRTTPI